MTVSPEFRLGYEHGVATKRYVSRREVEAWSPGWTTDQVDRYLNGRDDGVAGDDWRLRQPWPPIVIDDGTARSDR